MNTSWSSLFRTKSPSAAVAEAARERRLRRVLGPLDLVALGIGATVGTGIFVLTGVAAARFAGPAVILSFVLAGSAAALTALVYAELASMVPVAGSAYTYAYVALGELVAWVIGWDLVLEYVVVGGAVAIGWGAYVVDLLTGIGVRLPAHLLRPPGEGGIVNLPPVLVVAALTGLLATGTRGSASVNRLVVGVKLTAMLFFVALGLFYVRPGHWTPFFPFGAAGVTRGAAIVFFAFIGFDAVSTAAEETRNPAHDIPAGIIGSLAAASVLYLGVAGVLTGMVAYRDLDTASPLTYALYRVGAGWAAPVVGAGAVAGLTSVLLVNIYGQSRVFYAMARDGLLPALFARVNPRTGAPTAVIVLTGLAVALVAAFLPLATVAELANIGTLSAFVLVSAGVVVLRHRRPELARPFRVPLVPFLPALAATAALYLMTRLPLLTWMRFGAWLAAGAPIYFLYGRRRSRLPRTG